MSTVIHPCWIQKPHTMSPDFQRNSHACPYQNSKSSTLVPSMHLSTHFTFGSEHTSFLSASVVERALASSSQGPSKNPSLELSNVSKSDRSSRKQSLVISTLATFWTWKSARIWERSWFASFDSTCLVKSTTSYLPTTYITHLENFTPNVVLWREPRQWVSQSWPNNYEPWASAVIYWV